MLGEILVGALRFETTMTRVALRPTAFPALGLVFEYPAAIRPVRAPEGSDCCRLC